MLKNAQGFDFQVEINHFIDLDIFPGKTTALDGVNICFYFNLFNYP